MKRKVNIILIALLLLITGFNSKQVFAYLNPRLAGVDRYETSKAISSQFNQSDVAILVTGQDYPDALSATPLAAKYKAPILLTKNKTLDTNAESELKRLKVKNVFIIGGESVVSNNIANKVASMGITVERVSGVNRYETSFEVAKKIGVSRGIILATGLNYADALSIGPIAGKLQMPIVLVNNSKVQKAELDKFIKANNITKAYIVGSEGVVSNDIKNKFPAVQRIGGPNRYDTNNEILKFFKNDINTDNAYVAVGTNFPDALSGGALASLNNNPIILTNSKKEVAGKIITENKIKGLTILGSTGIISEWLEGDLNRFVYVEKQVIVKEPISLEKVEEYIIEMTNEERAKESKHALKYSSTMRHYARAKGKDMVKNNYIAHEDLNGKKMIHFMLEDGIQINAWGENLASNSGIVFNNSYEVARRFVDAWMNSPGHRECILDTIYEEIGVGVMKSGNGYYAVQEFLNPVR